MKLLLSALLCGVLAVPVVRAQKPRDPEQDKQHSEDNRVENGAERLTQPGESERDRFLKEAAKLRPADPVNEPAKAEMDALFDRLAGGPEEWTIDAARQRGVRDLFERATARLNMTEPFMTRTQFRTYAGNFLRPESSPPWRTPADDEDRAFRQLDLNRDGALDPGEATVTLRESLAQYDANRNGLIERIEYATYFSARVGVLAKRMEDARQARAAKEAARAGQVPAATAPAATAPAKSTTSATSAKPAPIEAIRFGHLPRGLPEWFALFDMDRDGQIGLYEWRRRGRSLEEFSSLDENGDGLMTPEEWLHFERTHPEESVVYAAIQQSPPSPQPPMKFKGMNPASRPR